MINFAVKGGEIAHKYRNLSVEANLFSVIGDVKKQMGLLDDSYLYYQKAIDLLKGSNNPRELSMLSYFYGTLMTAYMDNHLLEKAIEIGEIRRELIAVLPEWKVRRKVILIVSMVICIARWLMHYFGW